MRVKSGLNVPDLSLSHGHIVQCTPLCLRHSINPAVRPFPGPEGLSADRSGLFQPASPVRIIWNINMLGNFARK